MERLKNEEMKNKIDATGLSRIDFAKQAELSAAYIGAICTGKVKTEKIKASTYYRIIKTLERLENE